VKASILEVEVTEVDSAIHNDGIDDDDDDDGEE
jgi:hypothetical protein